MGFAIGVAIQVVDVDGHAVRLAPDRDLDPVNIQEALRLAQESYALGRAPLFVVLNAQRGLARARAGAVEVALARTLANIELDKITAFRRSTSRPTR